MNAFRLVARGLRFGWRLHLLVALGVALATAVLVGALAVGDSLRELLAQRVQRRVGRIAAALVTRDRTFGADLAERLAALVPAAAPAPVLLLPGHVSTPDRGGSARRAQVLGVDGRFFALGQGGRGAAEPAPGHAFVNEALARRLDVGSGDPLVLRVDRPNGLPRSGVFAALHGQEAALRVVVAGVLAADRLGDFALHAEASEACNVFVARSWLARELGHQDRANGLLLGARGDLEVLDAANRALARCWTLADAGLSLDALPGGQEFELRSRRVLIEPPVAAAAAGLGAGLTGVSTWFVEGLGHGARTTPYSMVAAVGPLAGATGAEPPPPLAALAAGLGPDGVAVGAWLADDLGLRVGDDLDLRYFALGERLELVRRRCVLRVHAVVPHAGAAADPGLMPEIPGLRTESCRDWEPALPIELARIRDVDELYWKERRGTPKAFLELATGQALWGSGFGTLTAIRGPMALAAPLEARILGAVAPASLGLEVRDVRGPAFASATPATDFGALFTGLGGFVIAAALLLATLLFAFGIERRTHTIGLLLAVGLRPALVRRLLLAEAVVVAGLGCCAGCGLAIGYARLVLGTLGALWGGSIAPHSLTLHLRPATVALGAAATFVVAIAALCVVLRSSAAPTATLLAGRAAATGACNRPLFAKGRVAGPLGAALLVLGAAIAACAGTSSEQSTAAFFAAGATLLLGSLLGCAWLLARLARPVQAGRSLLALSASNAGRRPRRSLATIALLATGTFLVVSVQAFGRPPQSEPARRDTGTGGFALYGETTLPVSDDPDAGAARARLGLAGPDLDGVSVVALRVRDGDDTSCLNLGSPQQPRLLGVDPRELARRGSFRIVDALAPRGQPTSWQLLDAEHADNVVPAFADATSIAWTLRTRLGATIPCRDERGESFELRLVGALADSILQGSVVISAQDFVRRFPSAGGFRAFLIDAPAGRVDAAAARLARALEGNGLELTAASERLRRLLAVQEDYVQVFQRLGALGLLLGSAGLALVLLRAAHERRSELALLQALGFSRGGVRSWLGIEHGLLLALGLAVGLVTGVFACLPSLRSDWGAPQWLAVAGLAVGLLSSGALWVWSASWLATRGPLLRTLAEE